MGCNPSITQNSKYTSNHILFQNSFKIPFSTCSNNHLIHKHQISQQIQNQLIYTIQKDLLKQFIYLIQQQNIPIQISVLNQIQCWNLIHLASRWDSSNCLNYILKLYFKKNPQNYIEFINMQTNQGLTALSICVIWNSINCFNLIANFGGIDLRLTDNLGNTVIDLASIYKRKQMIKTLEDFKKLKLLFIQININQLQNDEKLNNINDIIISKLYQAKKQIKMYRLQLDRTSEKFNHLQNFKQKYIDIEQQEINKMNQLMQQYHEFYKIYCDQLKKIRQNIEQVRQNYKSQQSQDQDQGQNRIGIKQKQYHASSAEKKLLDQQSIKIECLYKKIQQLRQKIGEINIYKKKGIQNIIDNNKKLEQQKMKDFLQSLKNQNNQVQLDSKVDLNQLLSAQKEKLKLNLSQITKFININNQVKKKDVNINVVVNLNLIQQDWPSDLQNIYKNLVLSKQNYIDSTFIPNYNTISQVLKLSSDLSKQIIWLRPHQIINQPTFLFQGIDLNSIKQGHLSSSYYLSTIAAISQKLNILKQIFIFYNKQLGFYVLRFYPNGLQMDIIIDDYIPCFKHTAQPLLLKSNNRQIWYLMIQKAWLKNCSINSPFYANTPDSMLEDILGIPTCGIFINNQFQNKINQIQQYLKKKYIIIVSPVKINYQFGMIDSYSYLLSDIYNINGTKIVKIWNPYNNFRWNGEYGKNSKKWTSQLKKKLQFKEEQQQILYLDFLQIPILFNYYSVGMIKQNYKHSSINLIANNQQDLFISFTLKTKSEINLRLIQQNHKYLNENNFNYSSLIFQVYKVIDNQNCQFICDGSSNSINGDKSINFHDDRYLELESGIYNVHVKINWRKNTKINSLTLASYAPQKLFFNKIDNKLGLNNWKNMIRNMMKGIKSYKIMNGIYYSQKWTKNMYIIFCKNQTKKACQVSINYKNEQLINCKLGLKGAKNKIVMKLRGNGSNMGTIEKIDLTKYSEVGSFSFNTKLI